MFLLIRFQRGFVFEGVLSLDIPLAALIISFSWLFFFSFHFLSSQLVTEPAYQVDKWLLSPGGPVAARSTCTTGFNPLGRIQAVWGSVCVGCRVTVVPIWNWADCSISLRGLASDPTVAAAGGRVPAMAVVRSIIPGDIIRRGCAAEVGCAARVS